jgi:hypothetical protein
MIRLPSDSACGPPEGTLVLADVILLTYEGEESEEEYYEIIALLNGQKIATYAGDGKPLDAPLVKDLDITSHIIPRPVNKQDPDKCNCEPPDIYDLYIDIQYAPGGGGDGDVYISVTNIRIIANPMFTLNVHLR